MTKIICKSDFMELLATELKIKQKQAEKFFNIFQELIITNLNEGNEINLTGFGKFYSVDKEVAIRRNPRTGQEIQIPAGKKVKFHLGKNIKTCLK